MTPSCRVLVGINESGKSNILRALSLLSPEAKPSVEDRRDAAPDEDPSTSAFVRFVFALDKDERAELLDEFLTEHIQASEKADFILAGSRAQTLGDWFRSLEQALYIVDVVRSTKNGAKWLFPESTKLADGWLRPSKSSPPSNVVSIDGVNVNLKSLAFIHESRIPKDVPREHFEAAKLSDLTTAITKCVAEFVEAHIPSCLFWTYAEKNLLPGKIPLASFAAAPATCVPLKHMFELARISDIQATITLENGRQNGIRNLLKKVSDRSTKYLHKVWKDYKHISIKLVQNGENIEAFIEDKYNSFDFSRRSDGFKRFITFLLTVGARVQSGTLSDCLLLYDEPDISLHPSGARYLRDELIRISGKNLVVYSTHSIFMIDRDEIERHVIVKKKDETTTASSVTTSNIHEEEVIYNALGYSVFESLKPLNIVFEGRRDKILFEAALKRPPTGHAGLRAKFDSVGRCFSKGAKDVGRVTAILELANRAFVIVSDGDKVARGEQDSYEGPGTWYRYDELVTTASAITAEDFVTTDALRAAFRKFSVDNPAIKDATLGDFTDSGGRLATIAGALSRAGVGGDKIRGLLNQYKEILFSRLKSADVEPSYYRLLASLYEKLEQAKVAHHSPSSTEA